MCVDVPEMQRRNRIARGGEARQDGYLLVVRMTGTVVGTNIIVIKSTDTLAPPCPLATARPGVRRGSTSTSTRTTSAPGTSSIWHYFEPGFTPLSLSDRGASPILCVVYPRLIGAPFGRCD